MKKLYYTIITILVFFVLGLFVEHSGPIGISEKSGKNAWSYWNSKTYNFWIIDIEIYQGISKILHINYPFGLESRHLIG